MNRLEAADAEPPSDLISAFVASLLTRWPDITSPAGDGSPWADGPLINNASGACIYFAMVWSQGEEASAFAASVAAQHGLVCFDPQAEVLRPNPGSRPHEDRPSRRRLFGRRQGRWG